MSRWVYVCINICIYLCVYLSVIMYLSFISVPTYLSIYLVVYLYFFPSLFAYFLSTSVYPSVYLSTYLSINLYSHTHTLLLAILRVFHLPIYPYQRILLCTCLYVSQHTCVAITYRGRLGENTDSLIACVNGNGFWHFNRSSEACEPKAYDHPQHLGVLADVPRPPDRYRPGCCDFGGSSPASREMWRC